MIKKGQVWKDRDPRFERYVKVLGKSDGYVQVQTCTVEGDIQRAPKTRVRADRFEKRFGLVG